MFGRMTDNFKIYEKVNGLGQTIFKVVEQTEDSFTVMAVSEFSSLSSAQQFREQLRDTRKLDKLRQFKTVKVYD